jgi:protein-tyrosine phosphatase
MVDIHCHILPNVDDGAKSWEMAEEMCRVAIQDGIRHIVCTPHANEQYQYNRPQLQLVLQQLKKTVGDSLTFSLGCDFHFSFENVQLAMEDPDQFVITGSDYLLVEFSDYAISPAISNSLQRLTAMGIRPVITHPERNLIMQRSPEYILRFAEKGCVIQVTANSLTGHWGEGPKKIVNWLLARDAVHVIASDAHDPKFRPPILSKARDVVAEAYDDDLARALVDDNPDAIVRGLPLPYFPEPLRR